jgi:hypothetical protein
VEGAGVDPSHETENSFEVPIDIVEAGGPGIEITRGALAQEALLEEAQRWDPQDLSFYDQHLT